MKTWTAGLLVLAVMGLCGGRVAADELDLGARLGYQKIADGDTGSALVGAFIRKDWHSVVFFELAVMYHEETVDGDSGADLDVEFIPIQLSAQLFFLRRDGTWCPYIQGGGGAYIVRTTDTSADESESEFDFGWHLGFGMDYVLTEKIILEADFRYIWLDAEFEGQTISDTLSDFNSWMASVGIGFRI